MQSFYCKTTTCTRKEDPLCTVIRSADGKLKPCLHSAEEYSIKGLDREQMRSVMEQAIYNKPAWHGELNAQNPSHAGRNMNQIGG